MYDSQTKILVFNYKSSFWGHRRSLEANGGQLRRLEVKCHVRLLGTLESFSDMSHSHISFTYTQILHWGQVPYFQNFPKKMSDSESNMTLDVTKEDKESVTEFVFEVILLSGISLFGLIGNISAIVLFTTMKRQLKFHRLMMMLSAFDLIYVALSFMLFALPKVSSLIFSKDWKLAP